MFDATGAGDARFTRDEVPSLLLPAGGQLRSALAGLNAFSARKYAGEKVVEGVDNSPFRRERPWNGTSGAAYVAARPGECCPARPTRPTLRPCAAAPPRRGLCARRP